MENVGELCAGVTLNGSDVGAGVLPVSNPNLDLNDYSFVVDKVSDLCCVPCPIDCNSILANRALCAVSSIPKVLCYLRAPVSAEPERRQAST